MGDIVFPLVVQRTYSVMTNDVLISIPLFVFMGYVIERANILDRLFRSLQLAAGRLPGVARDRDARHLRDLRHRDRHRRRGRDADGPARLPGHAARRLRREALRRRGLRRRLPRHPHSAQRDADPLRRDRGRLGRKLYAGAFFPGLMLAGLYMALRDHPRAAQSEAGAQASEQSSATFLLSRSSGRWPPRSCRSRC